MHTAAGEPELELCRIKTFFPTTLLQCAMSYWQLCHHFLTLPSDLQAGVPILPMCTSNINIAYSTLHLTRFHSGPC